MRSVYLEGLSRGEGQKVRERARAGGERGNGVCVRARARGGTCAGAPSRAERVVVFASVHSLFCDLRRLNIDA